MTSRALRAQPRGLPRTSNLVGNEAFAPKHLNLPYKTPLLTKSKQEKAVAVVRVGKIVISVIATTGCNDEILNSPDRRYKRSLLYLQ